MLRTYKNLKETPAPEDMPSREIVLRDCLVEGIATLLFVYSGTMTILATGTLLVTAGLASEDVAKLFPIAFAFGFAITVLVYSMGHITGGHMNPAVSLLMYFLRQISLKKMFCYWISQLLGAMLASALLWGSLSTGGNSSTLLDLGATTLNPDLKQGNGYLLEVMGSFLFFFVIAQVALDKNGIANSIMPPLAIGCSLVVAHLALIPFTGCGLNPARTFGPAVVVCMDRDPESRCAEVIGRWWWIYWIGPFTSSFLVAEFHQWLQVTQEKDVSSAEGEPEKEQEVKQVDTAEDAPEPEVSAEEEIPAVEGGPVDKSMNV